MPRTRRTWTPGSVQHVVSRFIDRQFRLESDTDRAKYLRFAEEGQAFWDWTWMSYALMSSHIHDGLVAGEEPLKSFYHSVHQRYAEYHRDRHDTLGSIFAGRPKNYELKPHQLSRMVAYHHRNPVSAGLVSRPSDCPWTSHRAYLRLSPAPRFLDVERALHLLGYDDTPTGRSEFNEFVCEVDLSDWQWHPLAGHIERPEATTTRPPSSIEGPDASLLLRTVAEECGITESCLQKGRTSEAIQARRVLVCLGVERLGLTMTRVAEILTQNRTALVNLRRRSNDVQRHLASRQAESILRRLAANKAVPGGNTANATQ